MAQPEQEKQPDSVIDDLQKGAEKALENTAEPRTEDFEGGPIDDKSSPAT